MFKYNQETIRINNIINNIESTSEIDFLEKEINKFISSPIRRDMLTGDRYYKGNHDILKRTRTVIGSGGKLEDVHNLPNNKIVDNQYSKLVDQKNNYLLGKNITLDCTDKTTFDLYNEVLNAKFNRTLNYIGRDSLNCGIGYLYGYINEHGELDFKRFKPYEVLPFWKDEEHTKLDMLARIYKVLVCGKTDDEIIKVELYKPDGVVYYELLESKLVLDISRMGNDAIKPYISINEKGCNWGFIPVIPFKSNMYEEPLIKRVKTLQDALNTVRSDFLNNMQEDARNTIIVLKNYDGVDLSEFRKNLSEYGAIKISSIDGISGGVETLKIDIDSTSYELVLKGLKKAIIENARGFDAKDERMSNNPNQMNIQSMLADIDLDANSMELEFTASLEQLFLLVEVFLTLKGYNVISEKINVIFNRDQLLNESEIIDSCKNSVGILSTETIISQHPWITDVAKELERLKQESIELGKELDGYEQE